MESLRYLKEYIEGFRSLNFDEFINIYRSLYSDYRNLQDKIEFSTLINHIDEFNLRFGLFKLYDLKTIGSFLKKEPIVLRSYNLNNPNRKLNSSIWLINV